MAPPPLPADPTGAAFEWAPLAWAAACGAAAFVCGLFTQSLREFSRGRLDDLCLARGKPDRFGDVLKHREPVLVAARAATFVLNVAAVLLCAAAAGLPRPGEPAPGWTIWELVGEWALLTAWALFFLSLLPWALSRVTAEVLLAVCWPALKAAAVPLTPLVAFAGWLDRTFHRLAGRDDPATGDSLLNEELKSVVDESEREGVLETEAGRMIRQVIELHAEDVAAVMTPRTDMATLPARATLEDARDLFLARGHSRMPVHGESTDDVVGVLYAKDLLRHLGEDGDRLRPVGDLARAPVFVPDTTRLDALLARMKAEQTHIALVVDEYGGVAGLVTLEDLLEEIVGEIVDEHDPETEAETGIRTLSDALAPPNPDGSVQTAYEVEGRVRTDDFNESAGPLNGAALPEDGDFDTVGGFVLHELARVPNPGDTFDWHGLRVTVLAADNRKVEKVRVEGVPAE